MFNRYIYGFNDPVNMIDPDGKQTCDAGDSSCVDEIISRGSRNGSKVNNFLNALFGNSAQSNRNEAEEDIKDFGENFKEHTEDQIQKIGNCTAEHFGIAGPAAIGAGARIIPKGRTGIGGGGKELFAKNTSIISATSRVMFGDAKFSGSNPLTRATGTRSVGGAVGRLGSRGATGAGIALLAVDAAQIGDCVQSPE